MEENIKKCCLSSTEKAPLVILRRLMALENVPMHGPVHHILLGASLLTAYKNAGGKIDLPAALDEMIARGAQVPGGICGRWGACGAAISAGTFVSIVLGASPLSHESWPVGIRMTGKALERISSCEGPRCCKRNCYHALTAAIAFASEELGVKMEETGIYCIHSAVNRDCIGEKCPYYRA